MSLFLGLNEDVLAPPDQPKIVAVRAYVTRAGDIGAEGGASDVHDTADTHWIQGQPPHHPPITNPMSRLAREMILGCHAWLLVRRPADLSSNLGPHRYPKYSESRSSWGVAVRPRSRRPSF